MSPNTKPCHQRCPVRSIISLEAMNLNPALLVSEECTTALVPLSVLCHQEIEIGLMPTGRSFEVSLSTAHAEVPNARELLMPFTVKGKPMRPLTRQHVTAISNRE
jgi:hypothetical protein